ncbi:hypothetical protein [Amycolatopsis sp. NBRC 101858]|nr:hypothetical protein [Amycolatopsis sp. NBRC 101858]
MRARRALHQRASVATATLSRGRGLITTEPVAGSPQPTTSPVLLLGLA